MIEASKCAAAVRKVVEEHVEWDSPHFFLIFKEEEDGDLRLHTVGCIMADIDPSDYSLVMSKLANEAGAGALYVLQFEGHSVTQPAPEASEAEKAAFAADKRRYKDRPESLECCIAIGADSYGRFWQARKIRGREGIEEGSYQPGHLSDAVLEVAFAYGER